MHLLHRLPTVWDYVDVKFKWKMAGEVQAALNEGINYLKDEKPLQAIQQFTAATRIDPSVWPSYYYRAMAFKLIGLPLMARGDLVGVLRVKPDLFEVNLELAKVHLILGDLDQANHYIHEALRLKTRDPMANYFYAVLDLELNYKWDALEEFARCAKYDPKFLHGNVRIAFFEMETRRKQDFDTGVARIEDVLTKDSLHQDARFARAKFRAQNKDVTGALSDADFLVRHDPPNPDFRLLRALLYTDLDMYDKAFTDVKKWLERVQLLKAMGVRQYAGRRAFEAKSADFHYAGIYLNRKMYGLGEKDLSAIKKGFCQLVLNLPGECIATLQAGTNENTIALYPYLLAIANEHNRHDETAALLYDRALRLDDEIFDAHSKRAIYAIKDSNWDLAGKDLDAMKKLDPTDLTTNKLRGILQFSRGDLDGALEHFNTYLNADSTASEVFGLRGTCLQQMKLPVRAMPDFIRSNNFHLIDSELVNVTIDSLISFEDPGLVQYARGIIRIPSSQTLDINLETARVKAKMVLNQWPWIDAQWTRLEKSPDLEKYKNYASVLMTARGAGFSQEGTLGKAEKLLIRATEYDATNGSAYVELGKIYLKMKNSAKANETLEKALKLGDKRAEKLLHP